MLSAWLHEISVCELTGWAQFWVHRKKDNFFFDLRRYNITNNGNTWSVPGNKVHGPKFAAFEKFSFKGIGEILESGIDCLMDVLTE